MTILNLVAKQDYLEKVAKTRDPIKAISEFVWNALDADATSIEVVFGVNLLSVVGMPSAAGIQGAIQDRIPIEGDQRILRSKSLHKRSIGCADITTLYFVQNMGKPKDELVVDLHEFKTADHFVAILRPGLPVKYAPQFAVYFSKDAFNILIKIGWLLLKRNASCVANLVDDEADLYLKISGNQ